MVSSKLLYLLCFCAFVICFNSACSKKVVKVYIDHSTKQPKEAKVFKVENDNEIEIRTIPIKKNKVYIPPKETTVLIENTNTLFYDYSLAKKDSEAEDLKALQTFLKALAPYAIDLPTTLFTESILLNIPEAVVKKSSGEIDDANRSISLVEGMLKNIDLNISGEEGINNTYMILIFNLASIHSYPDSISQYLRNDLLKDRLIDDKYLAAVQSLEENYLLLNGMFSSFAKSVQLKTSLLDQQVDSFEQKIISYQKREIEEAKIDSLRKVRDEFINEKNAINALKQSAIKAIDDASAVLSSSYQIEQFVIKVINASSTKEFRKFNLKYSKAKELQLKITPTKDVALSRYIDFEEKKEPYELKLTLQPRGVIKPSVGLSYLISPESIFPVYSTKEIENVGFEIVESSTQDSRFTWGLTLGADFRVIPQNNWLDIGPEFLINPSDDVKAFGFGGGVTIKKIVKLTLGGLWTKHIELDDQQVGQILPAAGSLKTEEKYGSPNLYFGISIIGWPPFIAN